MIDEAQLAPLIAAMRAKYAEGASPAEVLKWLRRQFGTKLPYAAFYLCISRAFQVPLDTLRRLEGWKELWVEGELTDDDVDRLLGPWFDGR